MGLQIFRSHLHARAEVTRKTVQGLLSLVESERNGDQVARSLLHSLLRMLHDLGMYGVQHDGGSGGGGGGGGGAAGGGGGAAGCGAAGTQGVAGTQGAPQFEAQFLAATTTYYEAEAAAQLQARDVPSYLQHVRTRLQQEEQRVVHYLHLGTRKPLLQVALNDAVANPNPNPDPSPTPRP
jgi:cullin-4